MVFLLIFIPTYIAMAWLQEPFLYLAFKFLELVTPQEPWFKRK